MQLLSFARGNPKLSKSDANGQYLSAILYLAPHKLSGKNLCPNATPGCSVSCLFSSGKGKIDNVRRARLNKSHFFLSNRPAFLEKLKKEISSHIRKAKRQQRKPCIRLNGTSDIAWERISPDIFTIFPECQFYDYTKNPKRMERFLSREFPSNYHLTFSRSENNEKDCERILTLGGSVAIVFQKGAVQDRYKSWPIFNGDDTDLRFLDPIGVIGLYAKGRARKDTSGFVIINNIKE